MLSNKAKEDGQMLLNQYKRVIEIDDSINDLHAKLSSLYKERSKLTLGIEATDHRPIHKIQAPTAIISWEETEYNKQKERWLHFTSNFPLYDELQVKLTAAHSVITKLQGESIDAYEIVIIPPAKILNSFSKTGVYAENNIYFNGAVPALNASKARKWHVYVVMTNPLGLPLVSYAEFKKQNQQIVSGFTMTSFTAQQYAAFLLTYGQWIDQDSWSVLTEEADPKKGTVPCVSKVGGTYQFELDTLDVLIGRNHFRPVMEIK